MRNLADPIKVDSSKPDDPMPQLAVVPLALFGQVERTYTMERAAHARAVARFSEPGALVWPLDCTVPGAGAVASDRRLVSAASE